MKNEPLRMPTLFDMNNVTELQLLQEISELKKKLKQLEAYTNPKVPTYQYSKIRYKDLTRLFTIKQNLDESKFNNWFTASINLDKATLEFLNELLNENKLLIEHYNEEDLKMYFIAFLLNKVHFTSYTKNIRGFYELPMTYQTSKFIFNGTVDFAIAEGLTEGTKPYFFIQEFKRSDKYGYPLPQLLAELISAIELNSWTEMKGAYIISSIWHFVILEKLQTETYQYFISQNFDSTRLDDLTLIYKNLMYVKEEIFAML